MKRQRKRRAKPRVKAIGIASIVGTLATLSPFLNISDRVLDLHRAWVQIQERQELSEIRLRKLERRARFLHGDETITETKAEARP